MAENDFDAGTIPKVLPIDIEDTGTFVFEEPDISFLGKWHIQLFQDSRDATNLLQAVEQLQTSTLPVAFPTETVYGLGADATREAAVAGIFKAKQRPSDNPLIVHISSLHQLRQLLTSSSGQPSLSSAEELRDPIPAIYHVLINRFWPGPLTILLSLPDPSPLARSVTGNLSTFGVRMPSSKLALALIHLAGIPIAAPSANASTRPSPTTAAHVLHDLAGRIKLIVDGGPCLVGVESTVVDGLVSPPVILRPGGVSIEMLRQCPGWENVGIGYGDSTETSAPRAPGMKYKHYSPTARMILINGRLSIGLLSKYLGQGNKVGLAKTMIWKNEDLLTSETCTSLHSTTEGSLHKFRVQRKVAMPSHERASTDAKNSTPLTDRAPVNENRQDDTDSIDVVSTDLGTDVTSIARNLFSALRELDSHGVDVILVEAIDVSNGHTAAAVMNRLRKAAELEIQS